jgi:excisionase family DNA binding protein
MSAAMHTLTNPPPAHPDALWDTESCAAYLGVSAWTLRHGWRRLGIPAVKVGGALRFRKASVDKWLDSRESSGIGEVG